MSSVDRSDWGDDAKPLDTRKGGTARVQPGAPDGHNPGDPEE